MRDIAVNAIDQLDAAVNTILQLESLFRSIRKEAPAHSDLAKLGALGEYSAMDHANGFDCAREGLRDNLQSIIVADSTGSALRRAAE
jgi:hypothetical protein